MTDLTQIKKQLARIDDLIDEAGIRLGAHSVKPVLMQELLELEEKRETLLEKIEQFRNQSIGDAL